MLRHLNAIPAGFLEVQPQALEALLGGPTLIHLQGRREPPLFISVLMHGNEPTGFYALQKALRYYQDRSTLLPRALSLFIGNVSAAKHGLRRLDGQPDYNRVWPEALGDTLEHKMMQQVVDEMRLRGAFASVDMHNNTGKNPHYGCINRLEDRFFHLATLFSRIVVYFTRPKGVQSLAFAPLCPAITLECGRPEQGSGLAHAYEYLQACIHLSRFPSHPVMEQSIDLFHTVAIVKITENIQFSFSDDSADLRFVDDLDYLNFRELPAGTTMGWLRSGIIHPLDVRNEQDQKVTDLYFEQKEDMLCTKRSVMPAMLTLDERVIRQDCLCYLMERYPLWEIK